MAKEICISSTPHETRLAILEDDQLAEIYYERENEYTLAGSIYNGRVTRVLPGMQSAFVDVGLERDAFLYVTDFMELDDPEETEEVEKAAASGSTLPPREVRQSPGSDRNSGRPEDRAARSGQKPEQKPEQKQEARPERPIQERPIQDRPSKDRRLVVEAAPETGDAAALESTFFSERTDSADDNSREPGAKRWRGRRRRRGGRGAAASLETQTETEETSGASIEEVTETEQEIALRIHASAVPAQAPRNDRAPVQHVPVQHAPVPFVLPGESLSKYGGVPAGDASQSEAASTSVAPVRSAGAYKPSTLIEAPLDWDGSGLLPGESLSKHRNREAEPVREVEVEIAAKLRDVFSDTPEAGSFSPDAVEEQEFAEETEEFAYEAPPKYVEETIEEELVPAPAEGRRADEAPIKEGWTEETVETAPVPVALAPATAEAAPIVAVPARTNEYAIEMVVELPSADEPAAYESTGTEPEADAAASHNVDPLPPAGFRLFGLGGKKKKDEEVAADSSKPAAKSASTPSVSAYSPGSGLIEEEIIEEEVFDAPRQHHHRHGKANGHDLDDFEEETLPPQIRSGGLGELLQEAQFDHRIRLNLEDKTGEDEDAFEDEDEDSSAEGQPAAAEGQGQQRRDRGSKVRRGRGAQAGQQGPGNRRGGPGRRSMQTSDLPIISDLLKPGQEILVQIAKEPIAQKGARITSHIALPGRFLVFMPTVTHIGVSRKIESDAERQRLKRILVHERGETPGGFIVRTAAEGASEEELRADLRFLIHLWNDIKQRSDSSKSPALIYHDLSLIERILRDQVSSNFTNIWVDTEANYERIVRFLNHFSPALTRRVKLYTKETPLFEHFGIQDEISKALRSKVWLKSGGSIVINQTEALVAIDINTGKYVGKSARLEDTIVKTNLDAVPEIVRQIRLRDLGGIIVIDFIDMDDRKNRYRVMAALEEALKSDRAPTKVLQFNDFGLVAITRKRVKQSLERTLSVPCPICQATGMVKSPTTVCNEIYIELRKMKKHFEAQTFCSASTPKPSRCSNPTTPVGSPNSRS